MSGNSDGYCIFYLFARDSEWSIEPLLKGVAGLEDGGQQEVEEGPQLWQLVLQWRASQQQSVVGGVVSVEDLGKFAVMVLHAVTLVDDHVLPANLDDKQKRSTI